MLITRECDYGIRIIRALSDGSMKKSKVIAAEEHIPLTFANKILGKLMHASYLQSVRGAKGGYRLKRPLDTITMADIITALDDKRCANEYLCKGSDCAFKAGKNKACAIHHELVLAQNMMVSSLGARTMDVVLYGA